jgi:hypothetical protein
MDQKCLNCGKPISGRNDKKFCDYYCRNGHNNKRLNEMEKTIKEVNSILRKNRSILKTLSPHGKTTVEKKYMEVKGFNFRFFTHLFKTNNGDSYFFCYEYGYLSSDGNTVFIVKWKDYLAKSGSRS